MPEFGELKLETPELPEFMKAPKLGSKIPWLVNQDLYLQTVLIESGKVTLVYREFDFKEPEPEPYAGDDE